MIFTEYRAIKRVSIAVLLFPLLSSCSVKPTISVSAQKKDHSVAFDFDAKHVNGLLRIIIWRASPSKLLWDVDLNSFSGEQIFYGVVPTAFATFNGGTGNGKQKFPFDGKSPEGLAPDGKYFLATLWQYDTQFSASAEMLFFAFTTDSEGHPSPITRVEGLTGDDIPPGK